MRIKIAIPLALFAVCLVVASVIAAPTAFEVTWWTIDGGGTTSTGGTFILSGTIGQPDGQCSSAGTYLVTGGFWSGAVVRCNRLYLPVIRK